MSGLIKNVLLALGLAIVLWLGYTLFLKEDESAPLTAQNNFVTSQAARDTQDFLLKLQQLRNIEFRQALFTDPRFQSLIDHRQDLINEPVGRDNPFAPI